MYRSQYQGASMYKSSMMMVSNLQHSSMIPETQTNAPHRIDRESAKSLAQKFFEHYNRSKSGKIEDNEARTMITDAYSALGKSYTPTDEDTAEYIESNDIDEDGSFTQKDVEKICEKFLCGPSGIGLNLLGVDSEKEKLLKYLFKELGSEPVNRELEKAALIFDKYDTDKDGYLDKDNLRQMIKDTYSHLKNNVEPSEEDLDAYLDIIRTKREGYVSREEYEIYMLQSLKNRYIQF